MSQQTVDNTLRVATYNIHKGVQGLGPLRRLEIHNLALAVEALDVDLLCLQEVRQANRREARYFSHWPAKGQAEFLAPEGYEAVYRSNAITRDGEHGNGLLSRWPVLSQQHEDISDHRLEQRGLLHVSVQLEHHQVHVLVVHLGLVRASRVRQVEQLQRFIEREVPQGAPMVIAGDFNEWSGWMKSAFSEVGVLGWPGPRHATFPSRLPIVQLDHVFYRGLQPIGLTVPRGPVWWQMSDHLPLIAEFVMPQA
jgi:endonuclease/exonuclease/phosphatase family metal-dependent hydrolase